mgnify:FL=1|tara:strand:+ start:35507 stop:36808 length:1302 start_codon:yes stop_codon:yes gene_type:complete
MKLFKTILITIFFAQSINLYSASNGITGRGGNGGSSHGFMSMWDGPLYYNQCVEQTHIKVFSDLAMETGSFKSGGYGIEVEKDAFQDYQEQLLELIQNTNNDKVNNIEEVFSQLTKFLIKQKVAETEQNIELRSKEQELEMEYQAALRSDIEKAKARSFGDSDPVTGTTGQFTYEYMKNMCKRTKMIDKTQGQSARKESTQAITKNNSKNINERQSVVSVVSESRKTQDRHYELFCSEEDRSQGLCDVVSALPNADLTADTFLKPEGFSSASDDYKTKFTYNETEALAANSFIKNVIGFLPVEPPTPEELTNKSKTQFVTMYNQILASLNTASLSFEKAYLNRLPKNKEGVRMSQLDVLNYLVEDMNSIQNQNLESQAKANAYEMSVQSVMAIKTKIDMEKLLQKERLKLLEATILALQENKPNKVLNLENKK